jgi:integration host factor subunit alpha
MGLGKKDIVKNISSKALFSSSQSNKFLEFFLQFIKNNKTSKIKISNFGIFFAHNTPPRIGRNPKTKKEYQIKSRTKLSFKASQKVKSLIN